MTHRFTDYTFQTTDAASVARTLSARLSDFHNVKDFGATGDGMTDDWAAIMAAFNWTDDTLTVQDSNVKASFTGAIASASFTGVITGGTALAVSGVTGTVAIGQTISPTVVGIASGTTITAGSSLSWTVSGALQAVSSRAMATDTATFTGVITNNGDPDNPVNTLTVSGVTGTISVGQAIYDGVFPGTHIATGSGSSWTVSVSRDVSSQAMSTNCVLTVSSSGFSGTIATDLTQLVVGSGVNPSFITSQFSGSAGSSGVYVLDRPQNKSSQSMSSASRILTFVSVSTKITAGMKATNLTNPAVVTAIGVDSVSAPTVTLSYVLGVINPGDQIYFSATNRGKIFFPPGTYVVSAPIVLAPVTGNTISYLTGCLGAATIVGDFDDYVITRGVGASSQSFIDKLNIVNNHATGGGIRLGGEGAALRDCNITANLGINTTADDSSDGGATSLEFTLINCQLNPGANTSGSIGIVSVANGAIANCRITGYEKGAITWGQQGGHAFQGCYFEGNGIGIRAGMKPNGVAQFDAGSTITGCWFKNNGTAFYDDGGAVTILGVRIDADESVTVYGSRPQYGIRMLNTSTSHYGVVVSGQYEQAAIAVNNRDTASGYIGVGAFNTSTHSGVPWTVASNTGAFSKFTGCNTTVVPTVGELVWPAAITSVTCSGNTVTLFGAFANITALVGTYNVVVSGVPVAGYNGAFAATFTGVNTFTYTIVGGPLANSSGGTAIINKFNLLEGKTFNISDSDTATWAAPVLGGGSTRALVRFDGVNLAVVGK